ncbi:MAG: hypothetical protein K9N55_16915 [Phycisphaerae bacterium]|nr:hypothetical protein [Phycisphaerae bacterium]
MKSEDRSQRTEGRWMRDIVLVVCLCLGSLLSAQTDSPRTRSELLNELSLRKAQVALDLAIEAHERYENEYEDSQRLFDQSIISKKELDSALSHYTQAQQQLEQARITLEETQLGFLDNATHITILEAKKYYDPNGRRMLDLVLKNTSNLNQAESALVATDPNRMLAHQWQNPESIRALLNIENIIVSIVDQGSSIGKPYEQIIPLLPFGKQQKLTFVLLTDVDQVGIRKQFLAKDDIETIYLEKESLQTLPTLAASQFSLEGALGSDIGYDLTLEMLVTSDHSFSTAVTNMPPQINSSFVEGGARITSVRFSEEVSKHALSLRVSIPQKLDVGKIDQKIDFQVWVATTTQLEVVNRLKRQYAPDPIPVHELEKIEAARVDLTLTPKGTGRLEILINNLYMEIKPQQPVDLEADLHNDGTLTLFNIIPDISPPLGWTAQVTPKTIEALAPNEKHKIQIHLQPGPDVGVGEYEARIETHGQSGSDVIEAIEKRIKVRINAETNLMVTLILVGGLVVLILGIVIFGVKLSRR